MKYLFEPNNTYKNDEQKLNSVSLSAQQRAEMERAIEQKKAIEKVAQQKCEKTCKPYADFAVEVISTLTAEKLTTKIVKSVVNNSGTSKFNDTKQNTERVIDTGLTVLEQATNWKEKLATNMCTHICEPKQNTFYIPTYENNGFTNQINTFGDIKCSNTGFSFSFGFD